MSGFNLGDDTAFAPCPCCFESSGYVWEHGNDWESGPWSHQTRIPCSECHGTGLVPCEAQTAPDDREDDYVDPGYERALDEQTTPHPTPGGDGCYCTHHPDDPAHGPDCYKPPVSTP